MKHGGEDGAAKHVLWAAWCHHTRRTGQACELPWLLAEFGAAGGIDPAEAYDNTVLTDLGQCGRKRKPAAAKRSSRRSAASQGGRAPAALMVDAENTADLADMSGRPPDSETEVGIPAANAHASSRTGRGRGQGRARGGRGRRQTCKQPVPVEADNEVSLADSGDSSSTNSSSSCSSSDSDS